MAGTSSAFYDLDSDGYGLSSRENIKDAGAPEIAEVESGLEEKARFTAELAGRLFQALQAHLMSLPPESRKTTLDARQLEELGRRKRLEAERSFLSDQLTQVCVCVCMSVRSNSFADASAAVFWLVLLWLW